MLKRRQHPAHRRALWLRRLAANRPGSGPAPSGAKAILDGLDVQYLFVGAQGGGKSAAIAYTLIETAKLNGVDLQAWLTHVWARSASKKITRLNELLPVPGSTSACRRAIVGRSDEVIHR
jgi:hypothetical protein